MPASAYCGDPAENAPAEEHGQVIDLASRRRDTGPTMPDDEPAINAVDDPQLIHLYTEQTGLLDAVDAALQAEMAAAAYVKAIAEHGGDLTNPAAAAAVTAVTEFLERLLYGAQTLRYGDPARGIPANPDDGLDHTGAQMMLDLARDLRAAAAPYLPEHHHGS